MDGRGRLEQPGLDRVVSRGGLVGRLVGEVLGDRPVPPGGPAVAGPAGEDQPVGADVVHGATSQQDQ